MNATHEPLWRNVKQMPRLLGQLYSFGMNLPPVYKFVNEKYMESFFATGDIRIGTLYNFRKTEQHGSNRGDPFEGKNDVIQVIEHHKGPANDGSFLSRLIRGGDGATLKNITLIERRDWSDAYVFCTSNKYSEATFWDWHEREGTTACYEIFDPLGFGHAIQNVLKQRAFLDSLGDVIYVKGDIDGATELHKIPAPFIKQKDYEHQTEFRWVWTAKRPAIDLAPKNFLVPDARRFCRKVARLNRDKIEYLWHKEFASS